MLLLGGFQLIATIAAIANKFMLEACYFLVVALPEPDNTVRFLLKIQPHAVLLFEPFLGVLGRHAKLEITLTISDKQSFKHSRTTYVRDTNEHNEKPAVS